MQTLIKSTRTIFMLVSLLLLVGATLFILQSTKKQQAAVAPVTTSNRVEIDKAALQATTENSSIPTAVVEPAVTLPPLVSKIIFEDIRDNLHLYICSFEDLTKS